MLRSVAAIAVAAFTLAFLVPAMAQDAQEIEWQSVITHQIQAFRDKDAPGAFSDAAEVFQQSFANPQSFFVSIISSGYAPIMESQSHSFGAFKLDEAGTDVIQVVRFVGPNQELWEALYNLGREPGGWRVKGVALRSTEGIGI